MGYAVVATAQQVVAVDCRPLAAGWDCGVTLRALHAADISWGTYTDIMGPYHCNAHVNNFVLLRPPADWVRAQSITPVARLPIHGV